MAKGVNKVQLLGRLGRDPELRTTQNGTDVCSFSLATDESYKDRSGNLVERAEWHRCVVWGQFASVCANALEKGSQVWVSGKLQTRKWQAQDGTDRWTTEVVVNEAVFLARPGGSQGQRGDATQQGVQRNDATQREQADDYDPYECGDVPW